MRNITFRLPADLVRQARILAARRDLSLNALVREALEDLVKGGDRCRNAGERLLRKTETGLYEISPGFWNRASLYD